MSTYRVLVHGTNFLVGEGVEQKKIGFYTSRYVEAGDAAGAESAAVDLLRGDAQLREIVRNGADDPPILHVEEIEPVDRPEVQPGFVFFNEVVGDQKPA